MKTIRLLYPDFAAGGLETYYFGANLLQHILPTNPNQPLHKVEISPPTGAEYPITDGIYGKAEVFAGIEKAQQILASEQPDKVITLGGNCMVSQASFDYLHGKYENIGVIWIDTHPDVSTVHNGYPNAHAYVLASLMGESETKITKLLKNKPFSADQILYVGLQDLHDYQAEFLQKRGVNYQIKNEKFVSTPEISEFIAQFDHILVHFDIDVLDAKHFHSTYFANPELVGDGSGSGKMTMNELAEILQLIDKQANIVGFTIAEYLPFDEHKLHKMFCGLDILTK